MFRYFINRPIFSSVFSIVILLCGLVAIYNLPIEQYPKISPPTIVVRAEYPGASAETAEKTIAAQLENKLNGVDHVIYMSSSSSGNGGASIRLTFEIGTNLDYSVSEVLNRVQAAMPLLPSVVQMQGVTVRRSSEDILMTLEYFTENADFDKFYLGNYIQRTIGNDLMRLKGIGDVETFSNPYAFRIWLDVNKLNAFNLTATDVENAIRGENQENVVGMSADLPSPPNLLNQPTVLNPLNKSNQAIAAGKVSYSIQGTEYYNTVEQFQNIIVKARGHNFIRLKDVARVERGGRYYNMVANSLFKENGVPREEPLVAQMIFMDPLANQILAKNAVVKALQKDAKYFPKGIKYRIGFDSTTFVDASIHNVIMSLRDAFFLVALIIFIFLHNFRASSLAVVAIPVAVIGTFASLYIFNGTINTISLFALILAVGIVVDDAVVIIENIERVKADSPGLPIKRIVLNSINEVYGAVIAISLVLSIVFVPVMVLGGLSGRLYNQFAMTIASTVIISAISALTLMPAIGAILLKKPTHINKFGRYFDTILNKIKNFYLKIAEKIINMGKYSLIILAIVIVAVVFIYKLIPLSFVPNEDQGFFYIKCQWQEHFKPR